MTGFVASAFDLFHAGHVLLLKKCRDKCDRLIVGLHVNPALERQGKKKPVQSILERQIQLRGCSYIDDIIIYETEQELETILKTQDIDVRFLGSDYLNRTDITGFHLIPITYIPRDHDWSSTELKERIRR